MPTADELLRQLCLRVIGADPAPKGVVIRIREADGEPNWTARSTTISVPHIERFNAALAELSMSTPMVDWSGAKLRDEKASPVVLASLADIAELQAAA